MILSEFNQGRSLLQDEFRKGNAKSVVVPDVVRQRILHDHHVTYCEIETEDGLLFMTTMRALKHQLKQQRWFKRLVACKSI